ncbi:hypothetical protein D3C85_1294540 [compost metagenome]
MGFIYAVIQGTWIVYVSPNRSIRKIQAFISWHSAHCKTIIIGKESKCPTIITICLYAISSPIFSKDIICYVKSFGLRKGWIN